VNASGERALLHRLGASAEGFAGGVDVPRGTTHVHVGTPFAVPRLRPKIPELLRLARSRALTTSLDTQWDSAGRWMADLAPSLPYTDYLFANHDEARMLTGADNASEAGARFRNEGARTVILKLGAQGCAVFGAEGEWRCPAFSVPALDTTGAGDCFVGAFLSALYRSPSLQEAAQLACAVAALSVQKLGAVEGLLSWDETKAWMLSAHR
jgi:sugar/nucleoside kinase (ribokinase family)